MKVTLETFEKIFFCTGARNHDILKHLPAEKIVFEYDERMASFKALGLAKMTKTPIAICCTSGTAVAECVPALLEARYSGVPLVLISGDRPLKMHGTGAPQTVEHRKLTSETVGTYVDLSLSEFSALELENPQWPLHVNVLVDDTKPHNHRTQLNQSMKDFTVFMNDVRSPLFLFSHEEESLRPLVEEFQKLGLPFYAETLSQGRDLSTYDSEMTLVSLLKSKAFDSVVRIGHTPLSKVWRLLESNHLPLFSFDNRGLPAMSYGQVAHLGAKDLLEDQTFWEALTKKRFSFPRIETKDLAGLLEKYPESEMAVMRDLQNALPKKGLIYLGNSLIIRFFELVQLEDFRTFGSRGVNGIDGQLATAIGLALGTKEKVFCILGDITTLYDLSSLREMPKNLHLIIMNNSGGRIFDMLGLDQRIVMEHETSFESIVRGMSVTYACDDLGQIGKAQVVELRPDQASTRALLKEWNA